MIRFSLLLLTLFTWLTVSAQAPDGRKTSDNSPTTYPTGGQLTGEALQNFDANFPERNVGFMHLYADPSPDPLGTYLLTGDKMSKATIALLPKKQQRLARKMRADLYAAAAVRGIDENLYIVRMDGPQVDRLEMFAIRGNKVVHLRTLALYSCRRGGSACSQLDSYLTDISGNGNLDLIQIARNVAGKERRSTFVMFEDDRDWRPTSELDTPWDSVEFFDGE